MNRNHQADQLSDLELDRLLQHASHPQPSANFEARLLGVLSAVSQPSNIIVFPRARKTPVWIAGVPLAASLVLGIWLGTSDTLSQYWPFAMDALTQSADALYSLTEDNLS